MIAITGYGIASAAGVGNDEFWRALERGDELIGPITTGRVNTIGGRFASTVVVDAARHDEAFDAARHALGETLEHAGVDVSRRSECRLALGTALAGIEALDGATVVRAGASPAPHRLARRLATSFELGGPTTTFSATCASALYALEQASFELETGRTNTALFGGVDTLSPFMQAGFHALGALSGLDQSDGLVLGEAACFVALEAAEDARALAWLAGRGTFADAIHLTAPYASGRGMIKAIEQCLHRAGRLPSDVRTISVTAAASPKYEEMYDSVIAALFDRSAVDIVTWEPVVGHVLAATGAVGVAHGAELLQRDPSRGDVLALTVGFGGQNGASLLRASEVGR